MSAPIKTSYDRTIIAMAANGATSCEVMAATGKTHNHIYNRAINFGVWHLLTENRRARTEARRAAARRYGPRGPSFRCSIKIGDAIRPAQFDHSASTLAATLRAASARSRPRPPVPGSFIACVFQAGLTLDDISTVFDVPPAEAVAAIRHHLEIRP